MERGSDQHGPRQDDRPEVDDPPRPDTAAPDDVPTADVPTDDVATAAEERMARLRHDLEVANDSRYEDREMPELPDG